MSTSGPKQPVSKFALVVVVVLVALVALVVLVAHKLNSSSRQVC